MFFPAQENVRLEEQVRRLQDYHEFHEWAQISIEGSMNAFRAANSDLELIYGTLLGDIASKHTHPELLTQVKAWKVVLERVKAELEEAIRKEREMDDAVRRSASQRWDRIGS